MPPDRQDWPASGQGDNADLVGGKIWVVILIMVDLAKLEGLAIGLEQRGEKNAAWEIRQAIAEIKRARSFIEFEGDEDEERTSV